MDVSGESARRPRLGTVAVLALGLALAAGCGDDSDPALSIDVGAGDGTATGVVRRAVPVSDEGDGIGTLHLTLDADCRNDRGTLTEPLGTAMVDDVDLSAEDDEASFEFAGLADGTYFGSAWFDDADNAEQDEDLPATGDLVMFGDLSPRCTEFTVADGEAEPIVLELDFDMPFTLPGDEGDAGVLEDAELEIDPADIPASDETHTVTMIVSRSVEPDLGGDGVGPLLGGLASSCFDDETGEPTIPAYPVVVDEVDLSGSETSLEVQIDDVPNGIYHFNAYVDDVPGEGLSPRPGIGDLVSFGGVGPACGQVVVNGKDASASFDLNLVMPFDL